MSKRVTYESPTGRLYEVEVPDDATEARYSMGIVVGPPDLDIKVRGDFEVRLHNELYARRIYTLLDCKRRIAEVQAAVMAACRVDAQIVMEAFLLLEQEKRPLDGVITGE